LDPPGIASRNVQECLIAQLNAKNKLNEFEKIALLILENCFEEFSMKHFQSIQKKLFITEDQLRDAFDEIKKLNPKPGGDIFITQNNVIIPDFIVKYDDKIDDFTINLNDSNIPMLKVSQVYEKMLIEAKRNKSYNKNTRDWMKERYEKAKFFIQAVRQRNISMLMIMTAIVQRQREFFLNDIKKLKPMIYQNITDDTSLDISTVCRVVNDKYVQTSAGIYELKFFFSESLTNDNNEEISTTVIKDIIKEIISAEPKHKPYSDDKIITILKKEGYNVARRTVAKYRETLKIPVARLRKEL
jgi:RNA polymerase sigma-54 factor